MPHWSIKTRGKPPVTFEAENWILAMGAGVEALYEPNQMERLVCEMLQNGTVLARDVTSGHTFIIRPVEEGEEEVLDDEPETVELAGDPIFSFGPEDEGMDPLIEDEPVDDDCTEDSAPAPASMEMGLLSILSAETAEQAWSAGLKACEEQIASEAGAALRKGPDEALVFVSTTGQSAHLIQGIRLPANTGFVGLCISQRICLLVHEAERDLRHYRGIDTLTGLQTRAVLCAPVASGRQIYGCLELLNPPQSFTQDDLLTLEAIGDAVGARLESLEDTPAR